MAGTSNIFGQWLRDKRVAKGFTLRKFAEHVGVSPTYLSHVEQGVADPPTAERVAKIADFLDVNSDEWIALPGAFRKIYRRLSKGIQFEFRC